MTPDRTDANPDENAEHGVLDEIGNLDTASITILGGHIAQVNVDLPVATDDDDLDDDVIEDEIPLDEADLAALDAPRVPSAASADDRRDEIVHDPHVEQLETGEIILEPHDAADETDSSADDEVHDAEIVVESSHDLDEQETPDAGHPTAEKASAMTASATTRARTRGRRPRRSRPTTPPSRRAMVPSSTMPRRPTEPPPRTKATSTPTMCWRMPTRLRPTLSRSIPRRMTTLTPITPMLTRRRPLSGPTISPTPRSSTTSSCSRPMPPSPPTPTSPIRRSMTMSPGG